MRTYTVVMLVLSVLLAGCLAPRMIETDQTEVDRLSKIIVSETLFRQADIRDAIEFIVDEAMLNDPEKRGIKLILDRQESFHFEPDTSPGAIPGSMVRKVAVDFEVPAVTFHTYNTSIMDLIRMVATQAKLKYRVEDGIVTLRR